MLSHAHYRLADAAPMQTGAGPGGIENGGVTELDEFGGGGGGSGSNAGGGVEPGPVNGRHLSHHAATMSMSGGIAWCAGCGCQITEQFLLQAVDRCWHTRCLKCHQCGCALCDLGDSCYARSGMILCRNDYLKMFGSHGTCSGCSLHIPATEFVLRSHNKVYHVNCFVCSQCHSQLQPGDRYAIANGLPVCEGDFSKVFGAQQQQQQVGQPTTGSKRGGGKKKQATQKQQQQQQQQQQPQQQQQQQPAANQNGQLQPVC